jgi:proteasome lid subunit RPN8/RPN11
MTFATFSRKAMSKITKHSLNVYPLEAYGFLIGVHSEHVIYAALPVGETTQFYEPQTRFLQLDAALAPAIELASSHKLCVIGISHSDSGGHPDSPESEVDPILQVPSKWRDKLVLVSPSKVKNQSGRRRCLNLSGAVGWNVTSKYLLFMWRNLA